MCFPACAVSARHISGLLPITEHTLNARPSRQLGKEQSDVFFHCDQLIRSIYSPFVRDWLVAFPRRRVPHAVGPLGVMTWLACWLAAHISSSCYHLEPP